MLLELPTLTMGVELPPRGLHSPPDMRVDDTTLPPAGAFAARKVSALDIIPMTTSAAALAESDRGDDRGAAADAAALFAGGGPGGGVETADDDGTGVFPSAAPSLPIPIVVVPLFPAPPPPPPLPGTAWARDIVVAGEAWYFQKLAMTLVAPVAALVVPLCCVLLLPPPGVPGEGRFNIPVFVATCSDTCSLPPLLEKPVPPEKAVLGDVSAVLLDCCEDAFEGVVAQDACDLITEDLKRFPTTLVPPKTPVLLLLRTSSSDE